MKRHSTVFFKILELEALLVRFVELFIRKLSPHPNEAKCRKRSGGERFEYRNSSSEIELHPNFEFQLSTEEGRDGFVVLYYLP